MKKQDGVTLIALTITIIVIIILAGISSHFGVELIREAKLQDLKTNMLLIQAKAKEAVEEVNFQKSNVTDVAIIEQIKSENLIGSKVKDNAEIKSELIEKGIISDETKIDEYYYLKTENLEEMGLQNLQNVEDNGYFIVRYNIDDVRVEVMNTKGYKGKYTLQQLSEE